MNDDDLTRRLEAWAAATDPAGDPITEEEVTSSTARVATPSRRRWSVAAAALLVVLAVGAAALVIARDDEPPAVVTDDGGAAGRRTQIVVETPDGGPFDERDVRQRYSLHGPCPDGDLDACAADVDPIDWGPLRHGTSLVVDRALESGTWALQLETYQCGSAGCVMVDSAGRPGNTGTTGSACTTAVDVPDGVAPLVRTYDDRCETRGDVPTLDVPPAWTLRPDLPWDCGQVLSNIVDPSTYSPERDVDSLTCVAEADAAGRAVELPIVEEGDPATGLREAWWRTGPDGTIEVFRTPGAGGSERWTRATCAGVNIGRGTEPGSPTRADLVDCTEEEPLPLEVPEPDGPAPAVPTNTEPGIDAIDVVVDGAALVPTSPPTRWRWAVTLDGQEVATGVVVGDAVGGYPWPQTALVVDDLRLPPHVGVVAATLVPVSATGRPNSHCVAAVSAEGRDGPVVVFTPGDASCPVRWADEVPELSVPPGWSLREPATACVDLAADARWGQCLADALAGGAEVAEWADQQAGVLTTHRVERGAVTVVRRVIAPDAITWTIQTCAGLEPTDDGRDVVPDGCGPEEPMALDPS